MYTKHQYNYNFTLTKTIANRAASHSESICLLTLIYLQIQQKRFNYEYYKTIFSAFTHPGSKTFKYLFKSYVWISK